MLTPATLEDAGGPGRADRARRVFLAGNGLPARWADRERFVVLDTAFGAGLSFLATWHAWRQDRDRCRRLHYVSIEREPFKVRDLESIHQKIGMKDEATALHAAWPVLTPGGHRLELDGGRVVLTLFFGDVRLLRELGVAADAVYLDGRSPAQDAAMWTPQTLRAVSRLAARGATLATWNTSAEARAALRETGFACEARPLPGGGEMIVARSEKQGQTTFFPSERKAAVVGAGLAGAAMCERLCARGWEVELHERHAKPAQEASGNLAGAFHPIVTPDDSLFARMTRAGFLYAVQKMGTVGKARWDPCGVLQLARDERELDSQRRAAALLPPDYVQLVEREEAARHAGVPVSGPGLWFPQGGWIQPASLVEAQLASCGPLLKRIFGKEIRASPPDAPVVILANGFEAPALHPVPHLRLRRVRGQLTYVPEDAFEPPHAVVLRGGMVLPPVDGRCVAGASFDIDDDDPHPRRESDEGNLQRLERILGQQVALEAPESRVAFRAVAPDRMPVVGHLGENVYGAFAYGSRGLVWSWIAAELLASMLEGDPLPLEAPLVRALDPLRFRNRAGSRGSPR